MKKFIFVILALLLTIGVANATNIPQMVDPKNYPTVWTELVYNGSGTDIATGVCVSWDFETSDSDAGTIYDDMASWVRVSEESDSPWTAGVTTIGQGIANGAVGRIIIRGPAPVRNAATAPSSLTADDVCGATITTGYVKDAAPAIDKSILGVVIKASAAGNDVEADLGPLHTLVYVNPTLQGS